MQTMPEHKQAKSDKSEAAKTDDRDHQTGKWLIVGVIIAFAGLILVSFLIGKAHPNLTERVKFVTPNVLNIFLLAAILVQAYIYRQQAEIMRRNLEAFYVSEVPYFGITQSVAQWPAENSVYADFKEVGSCPVVILSFLNGGKTPAWHFYAAPILKWVSTEGVEHSVILRAVSERGYDAAEETFYPSGKEKTLKYRSDHRFTRDIIKKILDDRTMPLHLVIEIQYRDMRDERHLQTLYCVLNPETGRFIDDEGNKDKEQNRN